ncbi:BES15S03c [Trypanosoma grayi]|uniref:BES15S03c n=1 Tax=Trypanosoma grayi TaxID=71804 RepID=UPI0004F4A56B|nr:BES15S03c [Trypanosoma grayi]KEG09120.1 BES15S03c [Trypanosoma grayi]
MPAAASWHQGPVPRIAGENQAPAMFAIWRALRRQACGITQHQGQPRLAWTQCYLSRSWGACCRAVRSIIHTKFLLGGNVKENPGPTLRGMQWNSAGLTQAKRFFFSTRLCRVSVITDFPSLLMALQTGPLTATDPILRLL